MRTQYWCFWVLVGLVLLALNGCVRAGDSASFSLSTSPPSAAVPTISVDTQECVLADGGSIHGAVTHQGKPAPDGTYVDLVYAGCGGLAERTTVQGGYYSLRLLAKQCDGALQWIGFTIYAGGKRQGFVPQNSDVKLDLDAPEIPTDVPDIPKVDLVFGSIKGKVAVGNVDVPDGTVVTATSVSGSPHLSQSVLTKGGLYEIKAIGWRASDGSGQFLPLTVRVLNTEEYIVPKEDPTILDINISQSGI